MCQARIKLSLGCVVLLCLVTPVSCIANVLEGAVDVYDAERDYFPHKAHVTHAAGFTIEYHLNYKIVTVLTPWRDADVIFRYVLVQRGTPAPAGVGDARVIEIPSKTVVSMATTYLPHIERLGLMDGLVGIGSTRYINSPSVRRKVEVGEVAEVGRGGNTNMELLLDIDPDIVLTSGSGNPMSDTHPKLEEAGIPVAINAEYMDTSPLGRLEWIKYVAAFFNREAEAERIFSEIQRHYEATRALTRNVTHRPTVLTNADWNGSWYLPGGRSYMAQFLKDAGAAYLWADDESTGGMQIDFEVVLDRAANADFWLNPGRHGSIDALLAADERYGLFAAVEKRRVYNNDKRLNEYGGNDYWETGIANPHRVLADLIHILHPDLLPEHELVWYRRLE